MLESRNGIIFGGSGQVQRDAAVFRVSKGRGAHCYLNGFSQCVVRQEIVPHVSIVPEISYLVDTFSASDGRGRVKMRIRGGRSPTILYCGGTRAKKTDNRTPTATSHSTPRESRSTGLRYALIQTTLITCRNVVLHGPSAETPTNARPLARFCRGRRNEVRCFECETRNGDDGVRELRGGGKWPICQKMKDPSASTFDVNCLQLTQS